MRFGVVTVLNASTPPFWFCLAVLLLSASTAYSQVGRVDAVTRASPSYAEQGSQVNLWIVGHEFEPGAQVSFSQGGLGPALVNEQPLPLTVFPNPASEGGMADGIQYFLRIAGGEEAPLGLIDVTVTNPNNNSSAVGRGLIEIVRPGTFPMPEPGSDNVDGITGASPVAANIGRNLSLWLWGVGFRNGARVEFSSPHIREYARSEVVEMSQSHPGFAGIRVFVIVTPEATPGPVDVTVINPNNSRATIPGLLTLIEAGNGGGNGNGNGSPIGECPDLNTSIVSIDGVAPRAVPRGGATELVISGQAFACGASVIIPGGGLSASGPPILERDQNDPLNTTLRWELGVSLGARLGPRDVKVFNPNNTHKDLLEAFEIVPANQGGGCSVVSFGRGKPYILPVFMFVLVALMRRRDSI